MRRFSAKSVPGLAEFVWFPLNSTRAIIWPTRQSVVRKGYRVSDQDEFLQQVKSALHHLYDYSYLESHPLAVRLWPRAGSECPSRAQRLHRLLLESIEELHPPAVSPKDTSRTRSYFVLVYRYVEEWSLPDITRELGCSRRQFFREQQKAIAMLAALLGEKLPQPESGQAETKDLLAAEAGRVLTECEAVEPSEVVEGVLQVIASLSDQHDVVVKCELDRRLPPIQGNRTVLRQVFLNALSTLIVQPGVRRVHLTMRYKRHRVVTKLTATPCDAVDPSSATPERAAPDSDPIRRLVEMVGGQWEGTDVGPEGRAFRFSFPTGSNRIVLVVEDNEAIIRAFHRYLVGTDYQVVGATSGTEALRLAREMDLALITLDVMMPTQDGWEILQALKDDPVTQRFPVVICSVLEDPALALSLGAAAYLSKPVTQADLLTTLDSLLAAT